jgi:MerR family transcriptional regulator, thiopeptide resistance regulator
MWTVTQLARRCRLSRSTLLYYESLGLMKPSRSAGSNYRRYGEKDQRRLEQICFYRSAGLKLADIRKILDQQSASGLSGILEARLRELSAEIERLREQQRIIFGLLRNTNTIRRWKVITKDKWVEIMKSSGFSEAEMTRWHQEFERAAPAEHQEFLEFLHIPADEIAHIREWSRASGQ